MTILQPQALFWILLTGVPLAMYFLKQRPALRQSWAAGRLLRSALKRVPVKSAKAERNLLLLRCLLIILLCVLFSRPVVDFTGTQTRVSTAQTVAVIVLDDSGSMLFRQGARSSFEEAVEVTARLIRNIEADSSVALCISSEAAAGKPQKLETDFSLLRRKLKSVQMGETAGDLLPGIRSAVNLLTKSNGGLGEIYVVTDNQALAWKKISEIQGLLKPNPSILFQVIGVGDAPENNLAVTGIELSQGIPAAGKSVGCYVTVSNFGNVQAENVRVTLKADHLAATDQTFIPLLEAGKSATVRLYTYLADPGAHGLTASISMDALHYDDHRSLPVQTIKHVEALIVEGNSVSIPTDRDGYFLAQALTPVPPDQKKNYYLQSDTIASQDLEKTPLKPYGLVILSNVAKLTPGAAQALSTFVEEGGGLVVFPGPSSDLLYYNSDQIFGDLLPAKLGTPQNAPTEKKFIFLQKGPFGHPMMGAWKDQSPESLAQVRYKSFFPLTLPEGADRGGSEVVLAFADGRPAIVSKKKGAGRIVLFNSTATTRWNNLPLHPAFVPLVQSMVGYLVGRDGGGLIVSPGEVFKYTFGADLAGKDFRIEGPQGSFKGKLIGVAEGAQLNFEQTGNGGLYSVFLGEAALPDLIFAVQPDPRESDLKKLPGSELGELEPRFSLQSGTRLVTWQKTGHELWMELALIIFGLALTELYLTYRLKKEPTP